jgi:hypothetical protein
MEDGGSIDGEEKSKGTYSNNFLLITDETSIIHLENGPTSARPVHLADGAMTPEIFRGLPFSEEHG